MYKKIIRPILFLFPPEASHHIVVALLKIGASIPFVSWILKKNFCLSPPELETIVAGIKFPNPVGVAAGFDKNALVYKEMGYLGFGFVEIGTVTPFAQHGNPKPRLFRLPADHALINRMGFNNDGAEMIAERLRAWRAGAGRRQGQAVGQLSGRGPGQAARLIVGGNIGKNKVTPNE